MPDPQSEFWSADRSGYPQLPFRFVFNAISALRALTQNRFQSLLTMTSIVLGVLSIVLLVAILQGVKSEVRRQLEGLGTNLILVVPSKLDDNGQPNPMAMMGISSLTTHDIDMLRQVSGVEQISPIGFVSGTVYGSERKAASPGRSRQTAEVGALVVATNREGIEMNPTPLAEGRYFSQAEEDSNVCVLAARPREQLFGPGPALGKQIVVQNRRWTVVGILNKPRNDGTFASQLLGLSNLVYLPYTAVRRQIPGVQINRIALRTDYKHPAKQLVEGLNARMRQSHNGREDFGVLTQEKGLALVIKMLNLVQSLLVLIAAISLVVAGVGIMNIMLMSVTARTREIGIRKTVGARATDIFAQFLIESVLLSLVGGVLGLVGSAVVCALIARLSPLTPEISPALVALALTVCSAVGMIFGVAPALRAARLNPIDALRHE